MTTSIDKLSHVQRRSTAGFCAPFIHQLFDDAHVGYYNDGAVRNLQLSLMLSLVKNSPP